MLRPRYLNRRPVRIRRGGIALAYLAVALVVLVGFVALGVDVGRMFLARSELQTGADAAARAAVWRVPAAAANLPAATAFNAAVTEAVSSAGANTADGTSIALDSGLDLEFGIWHRTTRTFTVLTGDARVAANAVRATPKRVGARGNPIDLSFASAVGQESANVEASAVAMIRGGWRYRGYGMGIVGLQSVSLNGTTTTDSYNAASGAYNSSTAHSGGTIGSNGDIRLVGTVNINGDARPGSDADDTLSVNANSTITGWQAPLDTELIFPPATAPLTGEYNNTPLANAGYLNANRDFILRGRATATIPSGVFFVRDLDLTANQTIVTTGPVKIYVSGTVDMTGSISVNAGLPSNFEIIVVGSGSVRLGGGSQLYAHVYAPQSDVTVHGTQNTFGLFGAVIGNTLTIQGNSAIHYDESQGYAPVGIPDEFYVELVR